MEDNKIQFYLAKTEEEYNEALKWVKDSGYGSQLKEHGKMTDITDYLGEPMDAYVFIFAAPNRVMTRLATHMSVPAKYI